MTNKQQANQQQAKQAETLNGKAFQDSLNADTLDAYLAQLEKQAAQGVVCDSIPYSLDDSTILDVITAQNQGLISKEQCAAFCAADAARKAKASASKPAKRSNEPYFSIGEAGGVTLNKVWPKKLGFPPSYKPVQFAAVVASLSAFASQYVENAETRIDINETKLAKDQETNTLKPRAHKRAGGYAIDFDGVDKQEFLSMCRELSNGNLPEQREY